MSSFRHFQLSLVTNGLMFIISGRTYALTAPFVGCVIDGFIQSVSVLPDYTTLALCIVGLVFHGFGIAGLMMPTFIYSIFSAVAAGFPDDLSKYGVISGLWSSSFALAAFVGPHLCRYICLLLLDLNMAFFFVISIHLLIFIPTVCFIAMEKIRYIYHHRKELDYLALHQKAALIRNNF